MKKYLFYFSFLIIICWTIKGYSQIKYSDKVFDVIVTDKDGIVTNVNCFKWGPYNLERPMTSEVQIPGYRGQSRVSIPF